MDDKEMFKPLDNLGGDSVRVLKDGVTAKLNGVVFQKTPGHGSAAVRALPSDLTEREQLDLLCQVETYMNVTDKHSQTHPDAEAEEARIYSLVNGFIAKRFSDIGAAVRGEAVAKSELAYKGPDGKFLDTQGWNVDNDDISNTVMVPIHRKGVVIALVVAEWTDDFRDVIAENCRILCVSPRAADAPSEPSDEQRKLALHFREIAGSWTNFTFSPVTPEELLRAADALDSQPTDDALDAARYRWLLAHPDDCGYSFYDRSVLGPAATLSDAIDYQIASSQPTDGGVRNG